MLLERLFENLALSVEPFTVRTVDPGRRLMVAADDRPAMSFVLRGSGFLHAGEGPMSLHRYSLALIPPRVPHRVDCLHESPLRLVHGHVAATYAGSIGLFDMLSRSILLDFTDADRMRVIFDRMLEEQRASAPGDRAMLHALMSECLVLVFRRLCDDPDCELPWLTALDDPRLANAVSAMLDHPEQHHSLSSLAARTLMSRSASRRRSIGTLRLRSRRRRRGRTWAASP